MRRQYAIVVMTILVLLVSAPVAWAVTGGVAGLA